MRPSEPPEPRSAVARASVRRRLLKVLLGAALLLALVVAALAVLCARDLRRARERIAAGASRVIATRHGALEFAEGGSGIAVLVIHGSGGGFDQGELVARAVLGEGFHWIAPSRLGYLRSACPEGATFDDQADAYVALLDHLGLERVAVVALSHGGPSALLLAARYPERVESLTLLSAGVASSGAPEQSAANDKGAALTALYQRDWAYWLASTLLRERFLALLGADGPVIEAMDGEQRQLADQVVEFMNPASLRAAGVRLDNRAELPGERVAAIRAPTLVVHAADDRLQLFANAEFAAQRIPGARLERFERGGHLVLVVERERVSQLVTEHVRVHARAH